MKRVSELEEDVKEKKEALAAQSKIYQEMDSRHQKQLEEIREAGHQTLAIMVEEYKVQLVPKTWLEFILKLSFWFNYLHVILILEGKCSYPKKDFIICVINHV